MLENSLKSGWFFSPDEDGVGGEPVQPEQSQQPLTPVESGVPQEGTPAVGTKDASVDWKVELQKREQDLNRMKSTFQRQISQMQKEMEKQRQQYEAEIRKLRMAGLSDDERQEYEREIRLQEAEQYKQQLEEYRQQMEEYQLKQNYARFFTEIGVKPEELITEEGLDALVQSGWEGVKNLINSLREELNSLKSGSATQQKKQPVQSPEKQPITSVGTPFTGTTWDDLVKKYGSEEAVFSKVERGELPPSVIPLR